jgi:bleomycin hydrolase
MNAFITTRLRGFAVELRALVASGADAAAIGEARARMLGVIYKILLTHFGTPPASFTWAYYDKDGKYMERPGLTPLSFARECVPVDVSAKVSLINDPRNEYFKTYTVDKLGNMVGGAAVRYLNVPIDFIKRATRTTLEAGKPVWFGCDVGKLLHRKQGIMSLDLFDHGALYGEPRDTMSKAERLLHGESLMTHAMLFTGVCGNGARTSSTRVTRARHTRAYRVRHTRRRGRWREQVARGKLVGR